MSQWPSPKQPISLHLACSSPGSLLWGWKPVRRDDLENVFHRICFILACELGTLGHRNSRVFQCSTVAPVRRAVSKYRYTGGVVDGGWRAATQIPLGVRMIRLFPLHRLAITAFAPPFCSSSHF